MTDKNTPDWMNNRGHRPNPTPQSFPKTASIPDSSQSKYNLLNRDIGILDNMQLANIQVRDKIMIIWVAEDVITILGYINTEIDTPEQVVPMVLLWSQLFDAYYQEIRDEISCRFDIAISDLSIQYMWLNRDNFSKSNFDLTDDELWKLPDFYNDMDEESLEKKTMQSFEKNTILFDPDYLEEGMNLIKVWETEYIYELTDDVLEIKAKILTHKSDWSIVGEYLSLEDIWEFWLDLAETIILSEGKNLEDITINYASNKGLIRQEEYHTGENTHNWSYDEVILKASNSQVFNIWDWIFLVQDSMSVENFSHQSMKICTYENKRYVYALRSTTLLFYWEVVDIDDNVMSLQLLPNDEVWFLGMDIINFILESEWLRWVDMEVLFKRWWSDSFVPMEDLSSFHIPHILDSVIQDLPASIIDILILSPDKTTLN